MDQTALLSISPLDGRYFDKLSAIRPLLSEFGLIKARVLVEINWLTMLIKHTNPSLIPCHKELNAIAASFSIEDALYIKQIEEKTNHDVKAVEYFIKEKCKLSSKLKKVIELVHFGATSEDINNLARSLVLKETLADIILPALTDLILLLKHLAHQHANEAMLARTHGQAASPTTFGKEMANFAYRLKEQITLLKKIPLTGKFNGAIGNYNALTVTYPEIDWELISKELVESLGLLFNPYTTQIEPYDHLAELFACIMRINTILIDFSKDMWGYIALNYILQQPIENEIGSSTMPHKINPIDFENAEGNAGLANALLSHMSLKLPISRWQRDLSDSTVLRNVGAAFSHSLLTYLAIAQGLKKITVNTNAMQLDLNEHWEILAEPIQMVMRKFHIEESYETLKKLTRGQTVTKEKLHSFINSLSLPSTVKHELLALTPANYLGYAAKLAKNI